MNIDDHVKGSIADYKKAQEEARVRAERATSEQQKRGRYKVRRQPRVIHEYPIWKGRSIEIFKRPDFTVRKSDWSQTTKMVWRPGSQNSSSGWEPGSTTNKFRGQEYSRVEKILFGYYFPELNFSRPSDYVVHIMRYLGWI